jgi:hypothetical protein
MKKFKLLTIPTRVKDLSIDDWYGDLGEETELKAERLRTRLGRKFKHEG